MKPGQIIRKIRQDQGMTLSQLAKNLSLDPGNLSRIERGEFNLNFNLIEKLSLALNASPMIFFENNYSHKTSLFESKSFIQNFRLSAKFIHQFNLPNNLKKLDEVILPKLIASIFFILAKKFKVCTM